MKRTSSKVISLSLICFGIIIAEFSFNEHGKFAVNKQSQGFGKTHFILGYDGPFNKPARDDRSKIKKEDTQSGAVDGRLTVPDVFFSPDDNVRQALINYIAQEQVALRIAVFVFTDKQIAQALIDAHRRRVRVELITDSAGLRDRSNQIGVLCREGIRVYVYDASTTRGGLSTCMHNKFVLFSKNQGNKKLVWTGSYNFTRAASETNQENALILDDVRLIDKFSHQFDRLKKRACKYGNVV